MIARKRLHIIVIALCLWLPLQAFAGQWLHCAQIESALAQLNSKENPKPHSSCHDSASDVQKVAAQVDSQPTPDHNQASPDSTSCKHCQYSCSWHSALVLREFTPLSINLNGTYIQFKTPSPAQPALEIPQRPPQLRA